nr:hypothetical protein [Angustibacter aerolatus]
MRRSAASWAATLDPLTDVTGLGPDDVVWLPGPATSTLFLYGAVHAVHVGARTAWGAAAPEVTAAHLVPLQARRRVRPRRRRRPARTAAGGGGRCRSRRRAARARRPARLAGARVLRGGRACRSSAGRTTTARCAPCRAPRSSLRDVGTTGAGEPVGALAVHRDLRAGAASRRARLGDRRRPRGVGRRRVAGARPRRPRGADRRSHRAGRGGRAGARAGRGHRAPRRRRPAAPASRAARDRRRGRRVPLRRRACSPGSKARPAPCPPRTARAPGSPRPPCPAPRPARLDRAALAALAPTLPRLRRSP